MNEALRIEWCKVRARAQRWQEECILLAEEMRRVIAFHQYHADLWRICANFDISRGATAYAWRQEQTRFTLIAQCERAWKGVEGLVRTGKGVVFGRGIINRGTFAWLRSIQCQKCPFICQI
ncbi:hypothetical protein PTI98_008899 [Pleurotus ostreatus]|nr:hypothetical protein PTI98_008899 [Pleurotus ostreatus]